MNNQLSTAAIIVLGLAGPVSALLGIGATLLFNRGLEKTRTEREHQSWLRERRYEVYSEMLGIWQHLRVYALARANNKGNFQHKEKYLEMLERNALLLSAALLITDEQILATFKSSCNSFLDLTTKGEPKKMDEEMRRLMEEVRKLVRPHLQPEPKTKP